MLTYRNGNVAPILVLGLWLGACGRGALPNTNGGPDGGTVGTAGGSTGSAGAAGGTIGGGAGGACAWGHSQGPSGLTDDSQPCLPGPFGSDAAAGSAAGSGGNGGVGVVCGPQSPASDLFLAATPITYPTDSRPSSLAVGDLDGNGIADVVIGGFDVQPTPPPQSGTAGSSGAAGMNGHFLGSVEVALGDQAKGFARPVRYGGLGPSWLGLADLNGDKRLDVVSVSYAGAIALLNTGTGTLGAPTTYPVPDVVSGVASGDLDGDGKADLVFSTNPNYGDEGELVVLESGSSPAFAAQIYDKAFKPFGVAVGELDGRAGLDVVVVGSNGVHIFTNDGAGRLEGPTTSDGVNVSVALADLDGDGKLDIVTESAADFGEFRVLHNLGGGAFASPRTLPLGSGSASVVFGDVDGDGKIDAVVWRSVCSALAIYLNDGKGSFAAPSYLSDVVLTSGFTLGDVNGDKRLDIVSITATGVGVRLHRGP